MINLESIKNRVRQILDDADANRFSDELLENAIRLTMQRIDEKIPLVRSVDFTVTTSGRDQTISGMQHPLYVIQVVQLQVPSTGGEKKIRSRYAYTLEAETATFHFSGTWFPRCGITLRVEYGAQNTLSGMDGAESSSLPEAAATALETGAAGYACLLRAVSVSEAYGARPGESARLVEQSQIWADTSSQLISKLRNLQEFSYPVGFALDGWDEKGE
jgi:hypothetical protein